MISRSKPGQQLATQNGSWRGSPSFGASWPISTPRWPDDWLGIRTCQHSVTYGRVTYGRVTYGRPTNLGARHHRGHLTDGRDWPSGRQRGRPCGYTPQGRPAQGSAQAQLPTISTSSIALTSGCNRTET